MHAVLPGRPRSRRQALATCYWSNRHLNAYISGSAFTVLDDSHTIIQSIYDDDDAILEAISLDEASGKIAVSTGTDVRIYRPSGLQDHILQWSLECTFHIPHTSANVSLSWGSGEELLVAENSLCLYATKGLTSCSWMKAIANPVSSAIISYDSAYIVSIGHHDVLTKVWRRLTYGSNDVRFDVTHLRHPDVVTSVRWRKPFHVDQNSENVLYTVCLDRIIRVWTPTDTTDGRHWQLWGQIKLDNSSIGEMSVSQSLFVCVVDGRDFTAAVEGAVKQRAVDDGTTDDIALDHLVAIANKNPEICIAFDQSGRMSAWALENVGIGSAESAQIFTVAQLNCEISGDLQTFLRPYGSSHIQIQSYCNKSAGRLHILMHSFEGQIGIFTGSMADILDPTTNNKRMSLNAIWSGHTTPITKMIRDFSGRSVVSRTDSSEITVWNHDMGRPDGPSLGLIRRSIISQDGFIHRVCVLRKGRFVLLLEKDVISLWDCRVDPAVCLATGRHEMTDEPLCLIILPRPDAQVYTTAHVAVVSAERRGVVWEISLPQYFDDSVHAKTGAIRRFCDFALDVDEKLKRILPVDPAGSAPVTSGFLDVFARDIAVSYTIGGRVDFWTARVDPTKQQIDWLSTCHTQTGISNPALISGNMLKKAALVDSTRSLLTIWDIRSSRVEFEETYKSHNTIQDLDWTSTPDAQSILAVGFQYSVVLLSQMRFDYLNKGPAWASIQEIHIREFTPHPIGDSTWLGNGHLVIGSGNQLFIHDRRMKGEFPRTAESRFSARKDGSWDLFEAVQRFNGPLPVFHPQFLSQCILTGKHALVRRILAALHQILKFLVPGETIDDYLELDPTELYADIGAEQRVSNKAAGSQLRGGSPPESLEDQTIEYDAFSENTAEAINEQLTRIGIPQLTGQEQIQLVDMVECVASVERHRRSLDENGARFLLFFRQSAIRKRRSNSPALSWREINWAYHSGSQDLLQDFVSRQHQGNMLWKTARESGIFMWLSDNNALKAQFEIVARNEYTKSENKSPVDCSLFYLALRKKAVLQGLWRMAYGNKEQAATQRLLANDFEDPKWRKAALKNAYALLSKRRFEYAAAFFLLADHLQDAVGVCVHQLEDVQLAIAVCRVYEGDQGPVIRKLLHDDVLPMAAQEGDRWLACWAFWMLGRKDMAVRALVTPVYTLLETPYSPDLKARSFLTDDPTLVILYAQLRHQTLQTLRGASKVTPKVEWEFVLHSAKLYSRMGCDFLGLDIVRNWEFQQMAEPGLGGEVNPLKMLRRRSSLVVDDLPQSPRDSSSTEPFRPTTTFEEPSMDTLFENFGI